MADIVASQYQAQLLAPQPARAVYIHIPFCTNKCFYCDFTSYVLKGQPVMDYLDAMKREMECTVAQYPPNEIHTIFVGGGTPTVLTPDQMTYFLNMVQDSFPSWSKQLEFTMEANPGTTDLEKLRVMRAGGVNRISFGVQSFSNKLLHEIGRIHSTDDVYASVENAMKAGFTNLSIDLMFGLPNQTVDMVEHSIEQAVKLDLPHISVYGLKVEENTLFHTMYHRNELPLPSEEDELEMYVFIRRRLQAAGYDQHEISNFSKPGYNSHHNLTYWRNEDYYGIGAGAHGYMNRERHLNIKGVNPYIEACQNRLPRLHVCGVDEAEAMEDFMMVGLRVRDGVSRAHFARQFDGAQLDTVFATSLQSLLQQALIEQTAAGYRLTDQGLLFGNDVFGTFVGLLTRK